MTSPSSESSARDGAGSERACGFVGSTAEAQRQSSATQKRSPGMVIQQTRRDGLRPHCHQTREDPRSVLESASRCHCHLSSAASQKLRSCAWHDCHKTRSPARLAPDLIPLIETLEAELRDAAGLSRGSLSDDGRRRPRRGWSTAVPSARQTSRQSETGRSLRQCLARVRSTPDSRRFAALRESAKSGRKET
jgi:hypothetical protein